MSTQGTGSLDQFGFERQLLDSWGAWSRSGDLGLGYGKSGYAPIELLTGHGVGIMFSDDEIMQADSVICALSPAYNRILKAVFLHRKWSGISGEEISSAVAAFAESIREGVQGRP
jgi:hypothetical protein